MSQKVKIWDKEWKLWDGYDIKKWLNDLNQA